MSTTENTGSMLFDEARGPLTNLFANLSGKHSDYWLESLKKMLRKEEIPKPPAEILEAVQSKNKTKEKIEALINFLKSIPVVIHVETEDSRLDWLLLVYVHSSVRSFSELQDDRVNYYDAEFVILHDFSVEQIKDNKKLRRQENKLFNGFRKEKYENLEEFCKAMYDLGILYEKQIPEIPNL